MQIFIQPVLISARHTWRFWRAPLVSYPNAHAIPWCAKILPHKAVLPVHPVVTLTKVWYMVTFGEIQAQAKTSGMFCEDEKKICDSWFQTPG